MKSKHPTKEVITTFKCKDCDAFLTSKNYKLHLLRHIEAGGKFTCPYLNCNVVFVSTRSHCLQKLTEHRRICHEDREVFQVVDPNTDRVEDFVGEDHCDGSIDGDHDHFDGGIDGDDEEMSGVDSDIKQRDDFYTRFWALWLDVEFCHILPESEISFIVGKLRHLAQLSSNHLKKKLQSVFQGNEAAVEEAFETEDWLTLSLTDPALASSFQREAEAKRRARILPSRQNNTLPVLKTSIKTVAHTISIEHSILAALEAKNWEPDANSGFQAEMDHVKNLRRYDNGVIASYRDSSRYKEVEASVPPEQQPGIHLQLYSDEFDRDLMGSSSKRHKVHVTYLRVLNVADGLRRTPEDYHLVQIVPSQTLQSNGYVHVMRPLIADIATVVRNGIEYGGKTFGVRLAILQGDGLERASMFGMAPNFSTLSHIDPLSYLTNKTRTTCQTVEEVIAEVEQVRDRESYAEDLTHLHDRQIEERAARRSRAARRGRQQPAASRPIKPQYEYSRGMKYDSPFNRIPHFHVTDHGAMVYCIAHDLYSGAFRSDMARVLVSLSNLKHYTWKELQDQFRTYRENLAGEDRQAWYDIISSKPTFKQLPGNHSSNHLVIRFLSSFWVKRSHEDSLFQTTAWSLYLVMKKISEVVSCKIVNDSVSQTLKDHVREYLEVILFFTSYFKVGKQYVLCYMLEVTEIICYNDNFFFLSYL